MNPNANSEANHNAAAAELKSYKVIGLYENNQQVIVDNITAPSGFEAMVRSAYDRRDEDGYPASDLAYMTAICLETGEAEFSSDTDISPVYANDLAEHFPAEGYPDNLMIQKTSGPNGPGL